MKRANTEFVESSSLMELEDVSNKLTSLSKSVSNISSELSSSLSEAINNLTCVLGDKLDKVIGLLNNLNGLTCNVCNCHSNAAATINCDEQSNLYNVAKAKLKELKNQRYLALNRVAYNANHAELYRMGLLETPQLVPRKKHEQIFANDADPLKEIKVKKTIHNVESEIEELLYHKSIQEEKVRKIDSKARAIFSQNTSSLSNNLEENWKIITKKGEESIAKIWENKRSFLRSTAHMIQLGSVNANKKHNLPVQQNSANADMTSVQNVGVLKNNTQSYKSALIKKQPFKYNSNLQNSKSNTYVRNVQYTRPSLANPMPSCDIDQESEASWTTVTRSKNGQRSKIQHHNL